MRDTPQVKDKGRRPWLSVITGGESLVSHAGGTLLVEVARRSGLARELSSGLGPWRRPFAIHDPGKIVLDMAVAVALGGDAACDVGLLPAQPGVFGLVASDPTVSRLIATLAEDADAALAAISAARATARERVYLAATGVGFSLGANLGHFDVHTALAQLPAAAWTPAYQATKPRAGQQCRGSNLATGPGSPSSPGWSTCRPGQQERG